MHIAQTCTSVFVRYLYLYQYKCCGIITNVGKYSYCGIAKIHCKHFSGTFHKLRRGGIVANNDGKAIEKEQKAKASTRAKNKYNASHYDSLRIVVPKGDKERIRAFADSRGQTINGFVNRLIKREMGEE